MPSKKKKYNARFPAGRIKKIMQSDEEIGKVAQAVPVIISRTLELFVESLLTKTLKITNSRNAKTLSTSHMKQCIMSEQRFDFLRELVKNIPDISVAEEAANYNDEDGQSSPEDNYPDSDTPYDLSMASTSLQATRSNTSINGSHNRSSRNQNLNGSHSAGGSGYPGLDLSTQFEPADVRNHLRQTVTTPLVMNQQTNSKVIHHSDHVLPIKLTLMRSESTPTHSGMPQQQHQQNWTIQQQQHQYGQNRQRLKNRAPPTSSCRDAVPSKQQKFENPPQITTPTATSTVAAAQPTQTAIPAPVVSFDFCNKPVVKIDYSHLSLSTTHSDGGPHSAPALSSSSGSSSSFNFSPAPVINIDLTNLVTSVPQPPKNMITTATTPLLPPSPNPAIATINFDGIPTPATTKATASAIASSPSSSHRMASSTAAAALPSPAIATITFDGIPAPLKPLAITTSSITSTIITPTQSKPSNPKATTMAMPLNISNTVPTKNTATIALSKNSFCELDEDYDNI